MYTVSYNGVSSSSLLINGKSWLHPASRPIIPRPVEDVTEYTIPGRDGPLTIHEGTYQDVTVEVPFSFKVSKAYFPVALEQFYEWLAYASGTKLTFSYIADRYFLVRNIEVDPPEMQSFSVGTVTVRFICEAWAYKVMADTQIGTNNIATLPQGAILTCYPVFAITNATAGVYRISRGGSTASPYAYMDVTLSSDNFHIDTGKMIAWRTYGTTKHNMSHYVSGSYADFAYGKDAKYKNYAFGFSKPSGSSGSSDAVLTITWNRRTLL